MSSKLEQQIEEFLLYLNDIRQLSPHTLFSYRRDLTSLLNFCLDQPLDSAEDIHSSHIRQHIGQHHRRGIAGSSIQRALSAIRSFYQFLGRSHGIRVNPAVGISAPKQGRKLPKTLDADQLQKFLQPGKNEPLDLRDRAIAELFYSSGLRLSELCQLNIADIDFPSSLVTVLGKGRKTRTLPVGKMALAAIQNWLALKPATGDEAALFTSLRGSRVKARNIQQRMRKLGTETGMQQNIHPHMLRHSFASHMLESSGDLRAVQELLGHADISSTQIYTHLDFQHLAKVYDETHPRAKQRSKNQPRKVTNPKQTPEIDSHLEPDR